MAVTSFTSTSTHNNKQPASSVGLQHNIITSTTKDTTKIEKQQEKELNVIICGGGPGGLLASVLLNNIGIKSTLVEKSIETDSWGIKSYTIILNDKWKRALKQADCLETAIEIGSERSCTYIFNGTTGEIKTIPRKITRPCFQSATFSPMH
ncbi:MAG: heterodisulfide reductase subunit A-like polyferredoxin [Bacillariaceae sp.]|jgi:heterodisulfide reductase subunit A-like polyferredoxin